MKLLFLLWNYTPFFLPFWHIILLVLTFLTFEYCWVLTHMPFLKLSRGIVFYFSRANIYLFRDIVYFLELISTFFELLSTFSSYLTILWGEFSFFHGKIIHWCTYVQKKMLLIHIYTFTGNYILTFNGWLTFWCNFNFQIILHFLV